MKEQLKNQLRELCFIDAISCREDKMVKYMRDELSKYSKNVTVDMLGNVTAEFLSGKENAQKILIFAHMDEVGLVIRNIRDDGFLALERLTAVNSHIIPGTVFDVRTRDGELIRGVVGAKAHHFMKAEDKSRVPDYTELFLDIGCSNKAEVLALGIHEGCVVSFAPQFTCLQNDIIATKSVDDRICCLALIKLAEYVKDKSLGFDLYLCASVQEEFNIRGIMPAARSVDADIAIGLDITPPGDTPDLKGSSDLVLGGGPSFTYFNYHGRGTLAGIIPNEPLVKFLEDTCTKNNIPFQRDVSRGVLTETAYIQLSGTKGVATAAIAIPTRYTHTPVETVHMQDLVDTIALLRAFVDSWDGTVNLYKV